MKYWKRVDSNGITTTVESYSFDDPIKGAVETTKEEFDTFNNRIPVTPQPDIEGFYHEFLTTFGVALTDALVSKHQLFDKSIQRGNWTAADQVIALAVSAGDITQAQADQTRAIAVRHNMPL